MFLVRRRARFNAAHRLYNPDLDEARNQELFGKCANPLGHGHNYTLEVEISGNLQEESGCVIDLTRLASIIQSAVIEPCDHKHLNHQVDFLQGVIPTTENLALAFYRQLLPEISKISTARISAVRLWETENNYAEYRP
jgi:6-pyruvoyltetrahydropterin/6-carboxytetrahydropterin synthase